MRLFFTYREVRLPEYLLAPDYMMRMGYGAMQFGYQLAVGNGLLYNGRLLGWIEADSYEVIEEVVNGLRLWDAKIVAHVEIAENQIRLWSGNPEIKLVGDSNPRAETFLPQLPVVKVGAEVQVAIFGKPGSAALSIDGNAIDITIGEDGLYIQTFVPDTPGQYVVESGESVAIIQVV